MKSCLRHEFGIHPARLTVPEHGKIVENTGYTIDNYKNCYNLPSVARKHKSSDSRARQERLIRRLCIGVSAGLLALTALMLAQHR